MKSSQKVIQTAGAVALILSGSAVAGDPNTWVDRWSVDNGTITAECVSGLSCGAALSDDGFMTRMVTDTATGLSYFQTIVTNNDETSTTDNLSNIGFSDENYVSYHNTSGIVDVQNINAADEMDYDNDGVVDDIVYFKNYSKIGTGWADDYIDLYQGIRTEAQTAPTGVDFQADFIFKQLGYASGLSGSYNDRGPYAKGMKLTTYVPIREGGFVDTQDFVLIDMEGDFVPDEGSVDPVALGSSRGGTLHWEGDTAPGSNDPTRGDRIYAVWVGQDISNTVGQQFGFTAYDNFTTTTYDRIQNFSLQSDAAMNWDTSLWGTLETLGTISNPWGDVTP